MPVGKFAALFRRERRSALQWLGFALSAADDGLLIGAPGAGVNETA